MAIHLRIFLLPINASLGQSTIFSLALTSAALLRVGPWGGFYSNMFPDVSSTVGYLPNFGFFILTICVSNTLDFWEIFRTQLCSWVSPFQFLTSKVFQRRLQSCWCILWPLPRNMARLSRPISAGISALVSRFLIKWTIVWWHFFGILLVPNVPCFLGGLRSSWKDCLFPCVRGDPELSEGLLRACKQCSGKSYPCLLVSLFNDKEGILVFLPCSPRVLLWYPTFL